MDITNELKSLMANKDNASEIVKNIQIQHEELSKKLYLMRVIVLAENLEEFISSDIFKESKISYIEIATNFDQFNKKSFRTYPRCLNENQTHFDAKMVSAVNSVNMINDMFKAVSDVNFNLVNQRLIMVGNKKLNPEVGIGKEILDIFLSDELKKIYEYNQMQIDLPNINIEQTIKPKV